MNPIEQLKSVLCDPTGKCCIAGSEEDRKIVDCALQALQAKLTAMEKQEPVAWMYRMRDGMIDCISPEEHAREEGEYTTPVYASPVVQQELTEEQTEALVDIAYKHWQNPSIFDIAAVRADFRAHGIGGQQP